MTKIYSRQLQLTKMYIRKTTPREESTYPALHFTLG
jgi:hypothetical protein